MTDVDLGPLSSLPPAQVLSDFGRPLITGISAAPTSLDLDTNTCFDITVSGFDGGLHYQSPVSHVGEFGFGFNDGELSTLCLPINSANGVWEISRIDTNNGFTFNNFAISHFGFAEPITVSSTINSPDIAAPGVSSVSPSLQVIDLDSGTALIDLAVVVSELESDLSGISVSYTDPDGFWQNACCDGTIPESVTNNPGVLRIQSVNVWDHTNNMTNLDRQNLLALSADTDIVINSSNPTSYPVITGAWHNSEGNWDGARGNPAYKFHVTAAGNVIISLKSMDSDAVVLDLFDSNGNRISRDDQVQATSIVGANLASGDYYVVVQNSLGGYGSFDLIFEGTVASNIELDTDRDGDPDSQDLNDDNDASLNEVDPEPLDWSVF